MRYLRLMLLPLVLVACTERDVAGPEVAPAFAAADASWNEFVGYNDQIEYAPCLGEDYHRIGPVWVKWHTVVNGNREIWTVKAGLLPGYQLVGQSSGHVWLPVGGTANGTAQNAVYMFPLGEPFQVFKTAVKFTFENQQTGDILRFPFRAHLVRNAAGEVKVNAAVEPCRVK